jgi:hypothetical protein
MKTFYPAKTYVLGIVFILLINSLLYAQVGINTTTPIGGSMLDITSTDKGILVPRIVIDDLNTIFPVVGGSPESLLAYNTSEITEKGYYYWNGAKWVRLDGERDWKLEGNAGTDQNVNFIGTTDAQDVVIKANNIERVRIGTTETVINEDADSYNFRAESNLESDMFFIDGGTDQVFVKGNTQHLGYIDAFNAYANSVGSATIGIQYAIAGWNQGNQGGGGNFVIEDVTNPFAAMEASTEGTGIANRGLITSTTSGAIATSGTSNDSNSYGVYGSVPTTGTWSGYGGIFTGGLAYANGAYNLSDARAKRDIKQIDSKTALSKILNIEGYTYKYDLKKFNPKSAADEKTYYGFMAQNVKEFLPHAVAQKKVPFRNEFINSRSTREESGTEELLNVVDYISIVPVIIEAMKEQQLQIEELKSQIAELEKK